MRWILIFWAMPIAILGTWYGLSINDMNFGYLILSRQMNEFVFQLYGQILGLPGSEALLGVSEERPRVISGLAAAPNPSGGGATRLSFQLSRSGSVTFAIMGVDGRALRTVPATVYAPGQHSIEWDGRDDDGRMVAPGVYFAIARTPDGEKITRIARLR